jgi:hypothetical protein
MVAEDLALEHLPQDSPDLEVHVLKERNGHAQAPAEFTGGSAPGPCVGRLLTKYL